MQPNFRDKHLVKIRNPHGLSIERLLTEPVVKISGSTVPYFLRQKNNLKDICGIETIRHNQGLIYKKKDPKVIARFRDYTWFE